MNFISFAIASASAMLMAGGANAQSSVTSMVNTLSASPATFTGKCPAVITFSGTIEVTGKFDPKAKPVQIGYTFLRSDHAHGPIKYYMVTASGTQSVSDTWTLGGPPLPTYAGWQQLKAWPTSHLGFGYAFSPKAAFKVSCAR